MATDLRQSKEWAEFLASQGWIVEEIDGTKVYIRKLPFCGSAIKIQRPPAIPPCETIDKIAKKHRAFFVKLEPSANSGSTINYQQLTINNFEPDKAPSLPTKNTVVDLTKPKEELWKTLSQDTRHDIREAEKYPISVVVYQPGEEKFDRALESFSQLLSETGHRQGFWIPKLSYLKAEARAFGQNTILLLAYPPPPDRRDTEVLRHPIVGFLILVYDGIAYYRHTATSTAGRKLNAAYLLMWKTIRFLKNPKPYSLNPIRYFNLGSIYDPRYHKATKKWQNFSTFKKKWHGYEVEYPPPLIKYYHPAVELIFRFGSLFD